MSESTTFSQPTSPTTGLQRYDLEPGAKELYPAPIPGRRARDRHAAWRKRFLNRGLKKGISTMSHSTIEAMVDTLRKSVASVAPDTMLGAAGEDTLNKSFAQFQAALLGAVDGELAKAAPVIEEPLYKGLGCVGAVASMVSMIADKIQDIAAGGPSWKSDGSKDPASEDMLDALDGLLMHAQGILHMAVNEHCMPADEGEPDMHVVMVKLADGSGEAALRTYLPEELAKFAADPAEIDNIFAQVGFGALAGAGVDTEVLSKALEGGELQKDAGMMGGAQSTPDDAGAAMPADDDQGDPLDTLARLAALMMIQVDYLKQAVDGDGSQPSDPTGENQSANPDSATAGTTADPSTPAASVGDDPAQKLAPTADLAKSLTDDQLSKILGDRGIDIADLRKIADANVELQARVAEFETLVPELLAKAAPAKAVVMQAPLEKGAEDPLAPASPAVTEEALAKMAPAERAVAKLKMQHATAGKPYRGS